MSLYSNCNYCAVVEMVKVSASRDIKTTEKSEVSDLFYNEGETVYIDFVKYPNASEPEISHGEIVIMSYCCISDDQYNIFTDTIVIEHEGGNTDLLKYICMYVNFNESRIISDIYGCCDVTELVLADSFGAVKIPDLSAADISLIISKFQNADDKLNEIADKFNDEVAELDSMLSSGIIDKDEHTQLFQIVNTETNNLSLHYCELICDLFADDE